MENSTPSFKLLLKSEGKILNSMDIQPLLEKVSQ